MKIGKFDKKDYLCIFLAFVIFNLTDLHSTLIVLQKFNNIAPEIIEQNIIGSFLMANGLLWLAILLKVLYPAIMCGILYIFYKLNESKKNKIKQYKYNNNKIVIDSILVVYPSALLMVSIHNYILLFFNFLLISYPGIILMCIILYTTLITYSGMKTKDKNETLEPDCKI